MKLLCYNKQDKFLLWHIFTQCNKTRPNRFEYEIESEILHHFNRFGARYVAYNSIIAGGENACILHYNENDQILKDGDLLLIDAGCEFDMYAVILLVLFLSTSFAQAQREIYEIVLKAQTCY